MKKKEQAIGTILSASCMTDMPAFYPQQVIEAVETRRKKGVQIHTLVLWTKHPSSLLKEPMYSYLIGLRHNGIQLYIQLTITGMGQLPMGTDLNGSPILVEPHAPKWEDSVAELPKVLYRLPVLLFKSTKRLTREGGWTPSAHLLFNLTTNCFN
jgi:hypothetical protein